MDLWAETITSKVRMVLPESRHMLIKVTFLKKDEETGTATGAATLHDQKLNKAVFLPLIVNNFKLSPLDIVMVPKKDGEDGFDVCPLDRETFAEVMFNSSAFESLERPIDRIQQMYLNPQNSVIYPPYFRNVYASAGGVMASLNGTISQEDKDAFLASLQSNKNAVIGYEKRAHLDILKKVAESKVKMTPEAKDKLKNITLLKQKDGDTIQMISTSDEVFDPIIEESKSHIVSCDLEGKVPNPEETLNEVKRNGEKMVFSKTNPKNEVMLGPINSPNHYTQTEQKPSEASVFASYKVQDKNGVFHKGIVIPNMIDFNMKKINGKVFISQDKCSFQDKIVGIPTGAEKFQFMKFKQPAIGMTGVFVTYNEKNALATIPITIRSMSDHAGEDHIVAMDMNGGKVKIKYGGYIPEKQNQDDFADNSLKNIAKVKDYYIVPRRFKFLAMDNFCQLMESGESMNLKTASMKMDAAPIRVIHTGASQFALKGPDMYKMASMCGWDCTNLSAAQSVFILSAKKVPLTKIAEALKISGSKHQEVAIHGAPAIRYENTHDPQEVKLAEVALKEIGEIKTNLIKEAAGIEDAQTVDTALSLNFINSDNVDKFIGYTPLFEQASKGLAQCLLASRLGITEIPEQETASCMHKMVDVIKGLKRLKTLEEKTASGGGLSTLLQKNIGKVMVGSSVAGGIGGYQYSKKKNYKRGFHDGAMAMNNYMNTRLSGHHMNKAASFLNALEKDDE
jgi:hypothetical protein